MLDSYAQDIRSHIKRNGIKVYNGKKATKGTAEEWQKCFIQAYIERVMIRGHEFIPNDSVIEYAKAVADWLTDKNAKPSLLISGGVGCGKSTLMNAVYKMIKINQPRLYPVALQARNCYTMYDTPVNLVNTTLATFLIIDDMGCEQPVVNNYGTKLTPMIDIISYRYDKQLPTIFTTNLDQDNIKAVYGERTYDRLKEMCDKIVCTNPSYRK